MRATIYADPRTCSASSGRPLWAVRWADGTEKRAAERPLLYTRAAARLYVSRQQDAQQQTKVAP